MSLHVCDDIGSGFLGLFDQCELKSTSKCFYRQRCCQSLNPKAIIQLNDAKSMASLTQTELALMQETPFYFLLNQS